VLITFGGFKGYRSGWVAIISQVLSLLFAYVITYLFVSSFADFLSSLFPLSGLLAIMVGGMLLFIMSSMLMGFIVSKVFKVITNQTKQRLLVRQSNSATEMLHSNTPKTDELISDKSKSNKQTTNGAIIGAVLGGVLGALSGVFIGWVYSSASQLFLQQQGETIQATSFQQTTNKIVKKVFQVAASNLGDRGGFAEGTSVLLSNPGETITRVKRIQNSGVLGSFFGSSNVAQALSTKNAKLVMQTSEFQQLVSNSDFIAITKQIASSTDAKDFKQATAIKITELWNQVEQVKQSHEFQDLLYSAEVQGMLRSNNTFAMLNSDKIARLLEMIANAPVPDIRFEDLSVEDEKQETAVFRWVDENGKVHYSDKKTDGN